MDALSATRQPNDEMEWLRTQMNGIIGSGLFQRLALAALAIALAPAAVGCGALAVDFRAASLYTCD